MRICTFHNINRPGVSQSCELLFRLIGVGDFISCAPSDVHAISIHLAMSRQVTTPKITFSFLHKIWDYFFFISTVSLLTNSLDSLIRPLFAQRFFLSNATILTHTEVNVMKTPFWPGRFWNSLNFATILRLMAMIRSVQLVLTAHDDESLISLTHPVSQSEPLRNWKVRVHRPRLENLIRRCWSWEIALQRTDGESITHSLNSTMSHEFLQSQWNIGKSDTPNIGEWIKNVVTNHIRLS